MGSKQSIIEIPAGMAKVYLVKRGEKSVLVDTGFPGHGTGIIRFLTERGCSPQEIGLIIITHGHIDHYGNALELREKTGALIAIHELDAEGPRKGIAVHLHPHGFVSRVMNLYFGRQIVQGFEPDILLKGNEDLAGYGIEGRVISTPGHTPGSVSVLVPEGAIVGDLIVGRFFVGKTPDYHPFFMNRQQMKESIKKLLDYSPKTFFACHGGPFKPEAVTKKFL